MNYLVVSGDTEWLQELRKGMHLKKASCIRCRCVSEVLAEIFAHQPSVLFIDFTLHEDKEGAIVVRVLEQMKAPITIYITSNDRDVQQWCATRDASCIERTPEGILNLISSQQAV